MKFFRLAPALQPSPPRPVAFIIHGASSRSIHTEERRYAPSSQDGAKPLLDWRNGDSLSNH